MERKLVKVCLILFSLLLMRAALAMEELKLIPMPREVTFQNSMMTLSNDWVICVMDKNADDVYSAELLIEEAKACFNWEWRIVDKLPDKNYILLKSFTLKNNEYVCYDGSTLSKNEPELFIEQGYLLTIEPEKIIIESATETGRFYGVQTLRQILRTTQGEKIPQLKIKDYPALKWRGISDDISRGQVSMVDDFKEIIRQLAFYKKNIYQPYIEDMFIFNTNPNIGKTRGAVTKEEMAQMVAEARKNHIVLTPVFECLGHQDRLLSLPENRKYAEITDPKQEPWSFSPVNKKSFEFVTKLIDELAEATPSPFFHIGGDESYDVGKGTSKRRVKKIGVGRVHAEYFSRLHDYLKEKHNRQMMFYSDMLLHHPEALNYLPKDAIFVDWHYAQEPEFPSVKTLKDAGFKNIIASPAIWSWASFYPNYNYGITNISNFTKVAKKEKLLGCITSSWGDDGAENLRENNWLGYAFSSAAEWEEGTPNLDQYLGRYVAIRYGIDSPELVQAEKMLGWLDYFDMAYPGQFLHHPLKIKSYDEKFMEKMNRLAQDMERVLQIIDTNKEKVRFDKNHIDSLNNVAFRYLLMAKRYQTFDWIARTLGNKKLCELNDDQQKTIINELETYRKELVYLIRNYEPLWLRNNKYPNLDYNLNRLERQVAEFSDFITLAKAGSLTAFFEPEATWFWYPDKDPTKETKPGEKYFIRIFEVDKKLASAHIKCWADDGATIFINGEKVLETEYGKSAVTANVRKLIQKGKNRIAIEGYNRVGAAGILLYLNIKFRDNSTIVITGDEDWLVSEHAKWHWKTRDPKGKGWKKVKLLGKGLIEPWKSIDW